MLFHVGQLYSRGKDIHDRFGGSRQSGISPRASHPLIFLFTGDTGDRYGYAHVGSRSQNIGNA
jgi:5-methylcytosine-specific restriction protein A